MLRSGRPALSVALAAPTGVPFGFDIGFDVVMIIGLLRPTETDCWWGTNGSVADARRPCLPGADDVDGAAARGGAVGRCVTSGVIGLLSAGLALVAGLAWWWVLV